jgi:hypothetical protein
MHDPKCEYKSWMQALTGRVPLSPEEIEALRSHNPALCFCLMRRGDGDFEPTFAQNKALVDRALSYIMDRRKNKVGSRTGRFEVAQIPLTQELKVPERLAEVIPVDFKKRCRIVDSEG